MEIVYRKALAEDLAAVFELLRQLWPHQPLHLAETGSVYSRCLSSDSNHMICAEDGTGRVVGFGSLVVKNSFWQQSFVGYVTTLVVDEASGGRGIGKGLLDELTAVAAREGCRRIELDSGFHREQAHLFYEHLQFEKRALLFSKRIEP